MSSGTANNKQHLKNRADLYLTTTSILLVTGIAILVTIAVIAPELLIS